MSTEVILAIISGFVTIIVAIISGMDLHVNKKSSREMKFDTEIMKKGTQQVLRRQLSTIYNYWKPLIDSGKVKAIPVEDVDEFVDLYNAYHDLGNNGVMTNAKDWMVAHKEAPDKL